MKYAAVFKAVDEARVHRVSAKLLSLPTSVNTMEAMSKGDAVMIDNDLANLAPLVKTGHRRKTINKGFNPYGLSRRESRF